MSRRALSSLVFGCTVAAAAGAVFLACDDRDDAPPSPTAAATTAVSSGPTGTPTPPGNDLVEPLLTPPVSQYIVLVQDLGIQNFRTDLAATRTLTAADFAASTWFESADEGAGKLAAWGFAEGYSTGLIPEGGADAVLNSAYVLFEEVTLYQSTAGAKEAFDHLASNVRGNAANEILDATTIANESIASRTVAGKVGNTTIDQAFHQVVFRRGNAIVRLVTAGAAPLMKVDTVLELAAFVDEKILGEREHPEPTPTPQRSPSPSATP